MGVFGLVLAVLYWSLISERKLATYKVDDGAGPARSSPRDSSAPRLSTLFSTPAVVFAYIGGGLQLFIAGSLFAWLPSYLNRAHGMAPARPPASPRCSSSSWAPA